MQLAKLDNNVIVDVLQKLFFNENKPSTLAQIDISVLSYLILRPALDHEIVDSYLTIADRVCADERTVARSLERLEKIGWVVVGGRGNGRSKALSVNIDKLPAAQPSQARTPTTMDKHPRPIIWVS